MKVALVIGHSQWSQGARAVDGIGEWTWQRVLAEQLHDRLPDSEVFIRNRGRYSSAMRDLTARINLWDPELILSLHFNALNGKIGGTMCLHWPTSQAGESTADRISKAVATAQGTRNRGPRSQARSWAGLPLYILRDTRAPSVLLESHYGDHADDHQKATVARDAGRTADAIAASLS